MNIHKLNEKKTRVKGKLIVGIDLAKRTNYAVAMLPDGIVIGKPFKFGNDRESFRKLETRINSLRTEFNLDGVLLSMEATSSYWEPLTRYFTEQPVDLVFVHGKVVKRSRDMMDLSRSKNDPKDAYLIAQIASEGKFMQIRVNDGCWSELRTLTLMRGDFKKDWVAWGNRIRSILEKYWPERELALKDCLKKTSVYVLGRFPFPDDVITAGLEKLTEAMRNGSSRTRGRKLAEKFLSAAQNSIGVRSGQDAAKWELMHAVELFQLFSSKLEEVDEKLAELLKKTGYYEPLVSIPGLSAVGAALLLGEIGDPSRYRSSKEWVKLAGLNLIENQSGRLKREGKRISRVGRPVLRHILYFLSIPLRTHNAEFKVHYLELRKRGKPAMKATVASMHKILRLTFSLCKSGQCYQQPPGSAERLSELKQEWALMKIQKAAA